MGSNEVNHVELHGRSYRLPSRPTVVICADGCDPAYVEAGLAARMLPTVARWREAGFYALADAVMPTFTNPNNLSIVTGAPPAVHGIAGNFALDRASGAEIMMTDPAMVRGATILALMSQAGVAVAAITAKDKLRRMLGSGLDIAGGGVCFSSEQADRCTRTEHGIEGVEALVGRATPDMYSADLSLFVIDAGIRLVEEGRARLLYLSLSDYVQHGHAPNEPEALAFHRALDDRLARLEELGCVVAVTADHGMNDKALPDGEPHVLLLEDILNAEFGAGAVRVICPITTRSCATTARSARSSGSIARTVCRSRPWRRRCTPCQGSTRCWPATKPRRSMSSPTTARPISSSPATATPYWARARPNTICRRSPGTGCVRTAAPSSRPCRSCCRVR